MAFIIPDETLEKSICSLCNKYLSVLPVKIYWNGDTKCGRCAATETPDNGVLSLISLFGDYCLYKCVNRFDGCREVLPYSQVLNHENTCTSKVYQCPVCQDGDAFTSLLLERHFLVEHESTILEYLWFTVNLTASIDPSKILFYRLKDFLFFISFRYYHSGGEIRIGIRLLGTLKEVCEITQQFWIMSPDNQAVKFVSKRMPCTNTEIESNWFCIEELDVDNIKSILVQFNLRFNDPQCLQVSNDIKANGGAVMKPYYVPFTPMVASISEPNKIHLTPEFLKMYPDVRTTPCCTAIIHLNRLVFLKCKNCNDICWTGRDEIMDQIYICNKDQHSLCYCCFKYLRSQLKIEEADYISTTLSWDMLKKIRFLCRWGCGKYFEVTQILKHEENYCKLGNNWSCSECDFQGRSIPMHHECSSKLGACSIPFSFLSYIAISFKNKSNHYTLLKSKILSLISIRNENEVKKISFVGQRIEKKITLLLFDSDRQYLAQFRHSITFKCGEENNFFLKVIISE